MLACCKFVHYVVHDRKEVFSAPLDFLLCLTLGFCFFRIKTGSNTSSPATRKPNTGKLYIRRTASNEMTLASALLCEKAFSFLHVDDIQHTA